ncbi:MAG: hypothetical protein M3M99_07970, partial [Actinomycetota bacterium]|nr:hypothetical protein [Actinomycetota bacterium]
MAADRFTPPDSSEQSKPAGNGEVEVVEVELMEPLPVRRRRDAAIDGLIDAGDRVARPIVRLGWRTARRVTRRLGVDRAVRRATDQGVDRALKSGAVDRTTERALDSEVADRVWKKVLESKQ